jgi:CRISPR system Cascade subunit CasE
MHYFSKIELSCELAPERLARAIPADAYAEHQMLWRLFGKDEKRRFLFRREQQRHWPVFYLLSSSPPTDLAGSWAIQTKEYRPRLSAGQQLAFSLRANPVRVRRVSDDPHDKRRRRDDVIMDAKRAHPDRGSRPSQAELVQQSGPAWLWDRAERHGFALETVEVDGYRQHRLYRRDRSQPIRFSTLDYAGLLTVRDPEAFLQTLFAGLGHAKAFGCGLLLVRRA